MTSAPSGYLIKPTLGGSTVLRYVSVDMSLAGTKVSISVSHLGTLVANYVLKENCEEVDFFQTHDVYGKIPTEKELALLASVLNASDRIEYVEEEAKVAVRKVLATRFVAEARAEMATIQSAGVTIVTSGTRPFLVVLSFVGVLVTFEVLADCGWMSWLERKLRVPILSVRPRLTFNNCLFVSFGVVVSTLMVKMADNINAKWAEEALLALGGNATAV